MNKSELFGQLERLSNVELNNLAGGVNDTLVGEVSSVNSINELNPTTLGHSCATCVDCWCSSHCFSGPSCTSGWY
jgi:hypothetical protein